MTATTTTPDAVKIPRTIAALIAETEATGGTAHYIAPRRGFNATWELSLPMRTVCGRLTLTNRQKVSYYVRAADGKNVISGAPEARRAIEFWGRQSGARRAGTEAVCAELAHWAANPAPAGTWLWPAKAPRR